MSLDRQRYHRAFGLRVGYDSQRVSVRAFLLKCIVIRPATNYSLRSHESIAAMSPTNDTQRENAGERPMTKDKTRELVAEIYTKPASGYWYILLSCSGTYYYRAV